MRTFVFAFCLTLSWVNAIAKDSSEKIIGLIEVPSIFGGVDPNGPPGQKKSSKESSFVSLHSGPNEKSKIVLKVSKKSEVVSREHGYEEESAVVYGQEKGWFLIKTKTGEGWLSPRDVGQFRRYEELVEEGLSYLSKNWDGRLYPSPGYTKNFEQQTFEKKESGEDSGFDVHILEKKSIEGELWFQIQLVRGRCEGDEKRGVKAWVPAYGSKGETNFWFYSRGC